MELSTIKTALDLLGNASKGLESVRERAKTSNDAALKESISKLYDDFLDLKAIIVRLTEENAGLRLQISQDAEKSPKPELRPSGRTNHYYSDNQGPFCQPCYDLKGKLIALSPKQRFASGMGRKCEGCKTLFIEESAGPARAQVRPPGVWS